MTARRPGTYWTRFSAASLAIVISAWIWLVMRDAPPASLGQTLFSALSVLVFGFCLLAGVRNTADSVSEEKREGTLGLLFLTDLKGYDVVLGKFVANSVNSIYAALALFPVLGLPLFIGGVPPMAFGLMGLLIANTLFFSLAAGIIVSALSRDPRRSTVGTLSLIALVAGGWPLLGVLFQEYILKHPSNTADLLFFLPSPGYSFALATKLVVGNKVPGVFWASLLTTHVLGWIFLVLACLIVPRSWQDKSVGTTDRLWRDRWQTWKYGDPNERMALRTRLLEINPFLWLGSRDRIKTLFVWGFLLLVLGLWLWALLEAPEMTPQALVGVWTAFLVHTVLKIWLTSETCQHFMEHRRSGAFELVLTTPVTVADILRGNLLALHRQFAAPVVTVLIADLLLLWLALAKEYGGPSEHRVWTLMFLALMSMMVLDCYALSWLGMWFGLSARNFNRASNAAIVRIMVLPWCVFLGSLITLAALRLNNSIDWKPELVLAWWFAIGVVNNGIFLASTKRKLTEEFRAIAAQHNAPHSARRGWRIFGRSKA